MQRYVHQDLNVLLCPVREYCSAFHEGRQEEFPVRTKKKKRKIIPVASFAIQNEEGKWLLGKRPEKGLACKSCGNFQWLNSMKIKHLLKRLRTIWVVFNKSIMK